MKNANVIIFPPFLLLGCIFMGLLIQWIVDGLELANGVSLAFLAILVVAGLFIDRWAQKTMRSAGTTIHPNHATTKIVETGAFSFSRNPIYLAQGLLLLSFGLLFKGFAYFLVTVPWLLVMQFGIIDREERYLLESFGSEYEQYKSKVRRWF